MGINREQSAATRHSFEETDLCPNQLISLLDHRLPTGRLGL
jgi:hypothetical protein